MTEKSPLPEWLSAIGHFTLGLAALLSAYIAYDKSDEIAQKIDQLSQSTSFIKHHKRTLEELPGALVALNKILNEINSRLKSETAQTTLQKDLKTFTDPDSTEDDIASALKDLKEPESETDIEAHKPYIPNEKFKGLVQNIQKEKDPQAISALIGSALEVEPQVASTGASLVRTEDIMLFSDGSVQGYLAFQKAHRKRLFMSKPEIEMVFKHPETSDEEVSNTLEQFKLPTCEENVYIGRDKFDHLIDQLRQEKSPELRYEAIYENLEVMPIKSFQTCP